MLAAPKRKPKEVVSFRASDQTLRLLDQIAAEHQWSRGEAIEHAVRDLWRRTFKGRTPPEIPGQEP